jgi:hypothetical protein
MRSELPEKETWECIAAKIREHGLPKHLLPKKRSVDTAFDRLADALLRRTERAIAKLKLNDRQRRYLIRVLRSRLRSMVTVADRRSSPRKLKCNTQRERLRSRRVAPCGQRLCSCQPGPSLRGNAFVRNGTSLDKWAMVFPARDSSTVAYVPSALRHDLELNAGWSSPPIWVSPLPANRYRPPMENLLPGEAV